MDPNCYRAAREGKVDVLLVKGGELATQVTPIKNTVLHVAALFGRTECVNAILINCPSLLRVVNIKGDTPLHIAAREGHLDVIRALIEFARGAAHEVELVDGVSVAKEMLGTTNNDGDTALHLAVRNGCNLKVVKMLIEKDPEVSHPPNKAHETPLYLAAEKGLSDCVSEILNTCTSPSAIGPDERTALHAAVIFDSQENVERLWNWNQSLYKKDVYGWTPLHYAAQLGRKKRVEQLLNLDRSLAYIAAEEDDNKTALHVAASRGNVDIMEEIKLHSPDCFDMVNAKGQNIIHIAVESKQSSVIDFYLENNDPLIDGLLNQKDNNGNTPLHLLASSVELDHYSSLLLSYLGVEKLAFDNEGRTPLDTFKENDALSVNIERLSVQENFHKFGANGLRNLISRDKKIITTTEDVREEVCEEGEGTQKKMADTNILVATLIATVSFAAGFTLPGGYNNNDGPNQGMAIMAKKWAFQAFLISDTIAMMCSSSAVFVYVTTESITGTRLNSLRFRNKTANFLLVFAQGAMMFAFLTGIFVVLAHSSGLAISVWVIGSLCILIYLTLALFALFKDIASRKILPSSTSIEDAAAPFWSSSTFVEDAIRSFPTLKFSLLRWLLTTLGNGKN